MKFLSVSTVTTARQPWGVTEGMTAMAAGKPSLTQNRFPLIAASRTLLDASSSELLRCR